MSSIIDERGYNQGFELVESTQIRMKRRADYMIEQMDLRGNESIMEIGCGTGEVSYWIAEKTGRSVLGTDLSRLFIDDAKKKFPLSNLRFEVLDFYKADQFKGERFDYIVGNGILHHLVSDLDGALLNLKNLLKDKGKIIFLEPNIYNPYIFSIFSFGPLRKLANLEPDEMAFSRSFIKKRLAAVGFSNTKVEYKDFLLPGIPSFLITPSIAIGSVLEKIPLVDHLSQSIYITATK